MELQHEYALSKREETMESIRKAEQDFHKRHTPLYANFLFGSSFVMGKIEHYLINDAPDDTVIKLFNVSEDESERLDDGSLTCGMELIDGELDVEASFQIAKHSQNALVYALMSLDEDDLYLVRDERLPDNTFILKHITDEEDGGDEDAEPVYSPDEKHVYSI
jgi:hypothetical protein